MAGRLVTTPGDDDPELLNRISSSSAEEVRPAEELDDSYLARAAGAMTVAQSNGFRFQYKPNVKTPEQILAQRWRGRYVDVVMIDETTTAYGARYRSQDFRRPGATPLRGPVEGRIDDVILAVMAWPNEPA